MRMTSGSQSTKEKPSSNPQRFFSPLVPVDILKRTRVHMYTKRRSVPPTLPIGERTTESGQVRSFLLQALQRTTHTNQAGSTLESQHTAHSTHAYTSYDCPPRIFVRARTSQRLISRLYTPHTTRTAARRRRFSEPNQSRRLATCRPSELVREDPCSLPYIHSSGDVRLIPAG